MIVTCCVVVVANVDNTLGMSGTELIGLLSSSSFTLTPSADEGFKV